MENIMFLTPHQKKKMAFEAQVFDEYQKLISVKGNAKSVVAEHLAKKYNVSVATIYKIRKRHAK